MGEELVVFEAYATHPKKRTNLQHFMVAMSYNGLVF